MSEFRFPNDTQRLTVVGKTGSGKTVAGVWHLSMRRFDLMPWIIVDFKGDELLNQIGAKPFKIKSAIPTEPGLYIVRPDVGDDDAVEDLMWRIWKAGNCGFYVDEGYMIDRNSKAFQAILTQGRSKRIPVIVLSQRPVHMSRFVFSEAEFYHVFALNDKRDYDTIKGFTPLALEERLPQYWSRYYDAAQDASFVLQPVPDPNTIRAAFRRNNGRTRRLL